MRVWPKIETARLRSGGDDFTRKGPRSPHDRTTGIRRHHGRTLEAVRLDQADPRAAVFPGRHIHHRHPDPAERRAGGLRCRLWRDPFPFLLGPGALRHVSLVVVPGPDHPAFRQRRRLLGGPDFIQSQDPAGAPAPFPGRTVPQPAGPCRVRGRPPAGRIAGLVCTVFFPEGKGGSGGAERGRVPDVRGKRPLDPVRGLHRAPERGAASDRRSDRVDFRLRRLCQHSGGRHRAADHAAQQRAETASAVRHPLRRLQRQLLRDRRPQGVPLPTDHPGKRAAGAAKGHHRQRSFALPGHQYFSIQLRVAALRRGRR